MDSEKTFDDEKLECISKPAHSQPFRPLRFLSTFFAATIKDDDHGIVVTA
jgi:hypothetical protein